jgi:hypothetical protein
MPAKAHFVPHWCQHSNDASGSFLNVIPKPYRRTNLTINMTRHKRLGGVHDGFYSALFHRPAAGGSSLFEDLVGILREAAGDAEVGQMLPPPFGTPQTAHVPVSFHALPLCGCGRLMRAGQLKFGALMCC